MRRYTELPTSQLPLKMRMSLSIPQPALLRLRLFGVGSINIGDWCPGFLEAGAPLVLVTAFKLLDMILEWVLDQNGYQSTFRFAQKLKALRGSVQFPPLIGSRPWLQTRIVSLYASLIPLRGTIIHDRHFQAMSGNLLIATSKVGSALPPVPISATDLRTLAAIAVSLVRYLEGTWTLDLYGELLLRYRLDQLAYLHTRKPSWANKSPDSSTFESMPRLVPFSRST